MFRTLGWEGVRSEIAWETRQHNQGYWEFQVLRGEIDGEGRWLVRHNQKKWWFEKR